MEHQQLIRNLTLLSENLTLKRSFKKTAKVISFSMIMIVASFSLCAYCYLNNIFEMKTLEIIWFPARLLTVYVFLATIHLVVNSIFLTINNYKRKK